MDVTKVFVKYLKDHALKITPERVTILNEINRTNHHFDPETLLFKLKSKSHKVSRATIYRTLDLLVDCGLVMKNVFGNNIVLYEKKYDISMHDHFLCEICGKIIEFVSPEITLIHQNIARKHGLTITGYTHQVYGICDTCKATHE
jgi:Fur family ferric uptake transcriptional regulator